MVSKSGVTRSVPNQVFILMNDPIRLQQGGRLHPCSQKIHKVIFCEQDKKRTMLPQAILPFTG
jgi:hypothetical protein